MPCANRTHHKQTEFFVCVQGTARSLSWVMHWPAIPGTRFRAGFVYNMGDEEASKDAAAAAASIA